jgi:hypothetical protein
LDEDRLMAPCRDCISLAIVAFASLLTSTAYSQERGDPIGALSKVSTFDHAQRVNVGKTKAGKIACYFREEGSSHSLDIGMTADGAFIRLETGDSRETTPTPPLRAFAGKQLSKRVGKDEYATDEYEILQEYGGGIEYYVPKFDTGDFVLVAKGDAKAFLEMVARAKTEFVVVQSTADKKKTDIVAIYNFTTAAITALLSCAKSRVQ